MSSLSTLRFFRRLPGLDKQPTYPDLEALIESEAEKASDEFHIARWVVPLVLSAVGVGVFIPLTIKLSPFFLFGTFGLMTVGAILGLSFHFVAKRITPRQIQLRKRTKTVRGRLVSMRNILGFDPALSPKVGAVLNEAAQLYLQVCGEEPDADSLWPEAGDRARAAMEEAMTRMLELAEPENIQAQEAVLARGWAVPLLSEMRALAKALEAHHTNKRMSALTASELDALAGLREARADLERLDQAAQELDLKRL